MKKVFIGSLSWNVSEEELGNFCAQVGDVEEAKVITDRETGRAKGFGFVTFKNPEDAQKAVEVLDGQELDGRSIRVNLAHERKRAGTGGRGSFNSSRERW